MTLPNWRGLTDQLAHVDIPFDLGGTKIMVSTSPQGFRVGLKHKDLARHITKHYLSKLGAIPAMLDQWVDIKLNFSSGVNYNFEKVKAKGLKGLGINTVRSAGCLSMNGMTWRPDGMTAALMGEKKEKSAPLRSLSLAIKADISVTPRTRYVPFKGNLALSYTCRYQEFKDRIDIVLMDIKINGGLKYSVGIDIPLSSPYQEPGMSVGSPEIPESARRQPGTNILSSHGPGAGHLPQGSALPLEGKSAIKELSVKQNISSFGISISRTHRNIRFLGNMDRETLSLMIMLVILLFMRLADTSQPRLPWDEF